MHPQAKKLSARLKKEFPKASALVLRHLKKRPKKTTRKFGSSRYREITHQEVETIKSWIHKTIDAR